MDSVKDSVKDLSPLQVLLDAAGAVVQEAKHHGLEATPTIFHSVKPTYNDSDPRLRSPSEYVKDLWGKRPLPKALMDKLLDLEKASGPEAVRELRRVEVQDQVLQVDKETVIKFLNLHFEADNPEHNSFLVEAKPTDYILRFFGEMFAMALGDAPNYITTEMILKGRGKEVYDHYELTIKKILGLSPREKYDDLLRRTQVFATAVLDFIDEDNPEESDHLPCGNDLKRVAKSFIETENKTPEEFVSDAENLMKALDLIEECKKGITEFGLDSDEVLMILNRTKDI